MSDMQQRIEALYRSDVRGSALLIVCLWATILFVLFMTWPYIPDSGIKVVVAIAAAAVLIFNTAAILAMVNHYKDDKEFIYGLDIKHADASAQPQVLRGSKTWPATRRRNKARPARSSISSSSWSPFSWRCGCR